MKRVDPIRLAIAVVIAALVATMVIRPRVNDRFHADYLANLDTMDALSGELVRDHLLVRNDLVGHYDFLEADLQSMAQAAELSLLMPDFIDSATQEAMTAIATDYREALEPIRTDVEAIKRSTGLVRNSTRAAHALVARLDALADSRPALLPLANQLAYAVGFERDYERATTLVDTLAEQPGIDASLVTQFRMHLTVLAKSTPRLEAASARLLTALDRLTQPAELARLYLDRYYATVAWTNRILWISYALAGILVALALLLARQAGSSRRRAEAASVTAEAARDDMERQLEAIHVAVAECSGFFEHIAQGDFSRRIDTAFDGELESLRLGANQAAERMAFTMDELTRIMRSMQHGEFDARLDERVEGQLAAHVAETMASLNATLGAIGDVMRQVREGDFTQRVRIDAHGSLSLLKNDINASMDSLETAILGMRDVMQAQAGGDFTRRIDSDWPGDLGTLARSINDTASAVASMVIDIQQVSQAVERVASTVLDGAQSLNAMSDRQSQSMTSALETVDNLRTGINDNQASTRSTSELVSHSLARAEEGEGVARIAIDVMQTISQRSREIESISRIIELIAGQTNLLSLNAAVEAARAREHGAGFAVVADEVRSLARESADASARISRLVQEIGNDVTRGTESVDNTGTALRAISESIVSVTDHSRDLADSSIEQVRDIDSFLQRMNEISDLIAGNRELARNTHTTSSEIGELAGRLSSLVAFFRVPGNPPAKDSPEYRQAA